MAKLPTTTEVSPASTAQSSAELKVRRRGIDQARKAVLDSIIDAEKKPGTVFEPSHRKIRAAALEYLNGTAAALPKPSGEDKTLSDLRFEMAVLEEALRIIDQLSEIARREEAQLRIEARGGEWLAVNREIAMAIVALERGLQKRDRLATEIRAGAPLPGQGFTFAGRLSLRVGQAYEFLRVGMIEGWVSREEFEKELENASRQ